MPLKKKVIRRPLHTRTLEIHGYSREDGLWELEATLIDVKAYGIEGLYRKRIPSGEPIHRIRAKVVVDDALTVRDADVRIEMAPFPMCRDITQAYAGLKGLNLGRGFMRDVRARFGGVAGCTHVAEMLGAIATTAFQTIYPVLKTERGDPPGRPALIDSCHAFSSVGEVVARQWPEHATPPKDKTVQVSRT